MPAAPQSTQKSTHLCIGSSESLEHGSTEAPSFVCPIRDFSPICFFFLQMKYIALTMSYPGELGYPPPLSPVRSLDNSRYLEYIVQYIYY